MVDMEEKREKKLVVVGLTRRHIGRSGSSSSPAAPAPAPAPAPAADNNRAGSEGGDYTTESKQKKGKKAKTLRWISSNSDMNNSNGEAEGSDGAPDETVLSSLTSASFGSSIDRKKVRNLGKVAENSDAVDPPVPRKLRSAINQRASRTPSSSQRQFKKRRHLSAISAQIFLMDHATRFKESSSSNHFTKEEEIVADTLLSLSQTPAPCEPMPDRAAAEDIDISNFNAGSNSSEGATKEGDKITVLPSAVNQVVTQPAITYQQVEQTASVAQVNPASQDSINPHLPKDVQTQDLSLKLVTNSLSPSKDSSNNSTRKQLKVQNDDSMINPAKTEAPQWLVNHNKPGFVEHDGRKGGNNSAQGTSSEIAPLVQTQPLCNSLGHSTKPSSISLGARANPITQTAKASATVSSDKISMLKNDDPTKTWKKSITHVYVSHLIQTHLNKDKASQNQVKPEERSSTRISRPPNSSTLTNSSTLNKSAAHFDARLQVQPSSGTGGIAASQWKTVGSSFLNVPVPAAAAASGAHHVQYLHPQMTHQGAMQYPYQHLPSSRGNFASAIALQQQQMQHYMHNPGYAAHPGIPGPSPAIMKLQQFAPTPQQQQHQQQMWQFHLSQYQQPRQDAAPVPVGSWQNSRLQDMSSSMRPMPPQVELLCAPYQGGRGGGRLAPPQQQQQLRLI